MITNTKQTGMLVISLLVIQILLFILFLIGDEIPTLLLFTPTFILLFWGLLKYVILMAKVIWIAITSHDDYGKDK